MKGTVSFVGDEHGGVTVMRDGHPQSYVNLDDPDDLAFEYVQQLAAVIDSLPAGPLAVTHVGGAGLTLARWVNHHRPESPQIVLEPDAALTDEVRRELPLPRRHRIRVRPVAGRAGVAALAEASADVLVVDAYAAGRVPADLTTAEFFGDVARVLRPGGVLLLNAADEPNRRYLARVHSAVSQHFSQIAALAPAEVWKGRRFGNTVLAGCDRVLDTDGIRRRMARSPFPSGLRAGSELQRLLGDARPLTDADPATSPEPPPADGWRLR